MKVLHTIPDLSANAGGPSTCTYYLLKGLNDVGVQADILTMEDRNGTKAVGEGPFIKVVPNDAFSPLVYSRNMRDYLRDTAKYEIYHGNSIWTFPSHITCKIARQFDSPFVLSPHGMLYPEALKVSSWKKKIILPLFQQKDLREASCLHATCIAEMEHFRSFGLNNPVAVIPNCLNISGELVNRNTVNSIRRVGFVGRINRIKNIDRLLVAWKNLRNITHEAELVIIGSGDAAYQKELISYVEENQLKNIRFIDFLTGDKLAEQVRLFDFQILPSKSENFGMVIPEALINRVPVIASTGTPWEELNVKRCGWWIDNDVETIAATLEQALKTPENERIAMGERGRRLILDKYTVERVAQQMKDLYGWLLSKKDKPEFVFEY